MRCTSLISEAIIQHGLRSLQTHLQCIVDLTDSSMCHWITVDFVDNQYWSSHKFKRTHLAAWKLALTCRCDVSRRVRGSQQPLDVEISRQYKDCAYKQQHAILYGAYYTLLTMGVEPLQSLPKHCFDSTITVETWKTKKYTLVHALMTWVEERRPLALCNLSGEVGREICLRRLGLIAVVYWD